MTDPLDSMQLTDHELGNFIRDLRLRVAANEAQLESPSAGRQRTIKILRGTILTAGGLVGASFEPFSIVLTIIGCWDWVDTIRDDVNAMNRQIQLRETLIDLERQIAMAEAELERRISARGRL